MYISPTTKPYTIQDIIEFMGLKSLDNRKIHPEIIQFQEVFRQSILSPESFPDDNWCKLSAIRQDKISNMYNKVLNNKAIMRLLDGAKKMEDFSFIAEEVNCFYKSNFLYQDTIFSFHVTNEVDYQAFVSSIIPSSIHLEAGFASDATGLNKFIVFGVQHFHPYEIFCVDLSHWEGPGGLLSGKHEYHGMLREIKHSNFIPSSWVWPI